MAPAQGRLTRRIVLAGAAGLAGGALSLAAAPALASAGPPLLRLSGPRRQGAALIGRTRPGARLTLDGEDLGTAPASGLFVIGFDRDARPASRLTSEDAGGIAAEDLDIAPVDYVVQRIDGLPPQMVTPTDPDVLAREAHEREVKARAFASRAAIEDFRDGFAPPLAAPVRTSPFGVQRVLNGEPRAPHYGVDLAAPAGTPILAPAGGLVVLAEPDLYLDGGLVLLDHGQGLISAYLHQEALRTRVGARLARGEEIGLVGMRGRATGPHLCWRMKWRGRNLDPSLLIGVRAPEA